jgi:hypothetical protein
MVAVAGVTAIDVRVVFVTVSCAVPEIPLTVSVAVIVTEPTATPVATPCVPGELLMVATEEFEELQVGEGITLVVPSAKVPVAVNNCVKVMPMEAVGGFTAIDFSGLEMLRVVVPEMVPKVAIIVAVLPGATPVAKPPVVMVASGEALHVTVDVMSCVPWLANVPIAVYCCVPLGATVTPGGVTAMDSSGTGVTVSVVDPVMPAELAEIVVVPALTPVAKPEILTVATVVLVDSQLAVLVRTFVVPSL